MIILKVMTGSTLAVVSLQFTGYNEPEKKLFYKKASDSDFQEWTTDRGGRSYLRPYTTQWEWMLQHWQLVVDDLEPDTAYDFFAMVGDDVSEVATVSTDILHDRCLYSVDNPESESGQILTTYAEDFYTIGQAVGFDSPFVQPLKAGNEETASSGYRSYITFGAAAVSTLASKSARCHHLMLHEMRHNLGSGTRMSNYSSPVRPFSNPRVRKVSPGGDVTYYNNTAGCEETDTYIYHTPGRSKLQEVFQFITGSPLARWRMYGNHSNCPDFVADNGYQDITLFFMLRAMMFNKIDIVEVKDVTDEEE